MYDYLAANGGQAFVNVDDPDLSSMASSRWPSSVILSEAKDLEAKDLEANPVIPYGLSILKAKVLPSGADHPYLRMKLPGGLLVETHLAGAYNATNVAAAIAVGLKFGVTLEEAIEAIGSYIPKNNRSQMERTERNVLIQDAYNANPSSMAAALDNLVQVVADRKVALLGDMRELGDESEAEHLKVLAQVLSMGLDLVCLVGEEFGKALSVRPSANALWFASSDELASWLREHPVSGATVLVKGSRGIQMEKTLPEL